jgi:hypothetical protein
MRYFILAPPSILFTILAAILSPVLALFVQENGQLPVWLKWFDTPDNSTYGDQAYRDNQMKGVTSKWWIATCWLARNPAYGFDQLIGAKIPEGFIYSSGGDELTGNTPLHEGWVYRRCDKYWQFYLVKKLTKTKCLKLNLGHKLWGELKAGQVRSLVCTINPFTKHS